MLWFMCAAYSSLPVRLAPVFAPTLMLIYSAIDILGSLQSKKGFANKKSFTDWTKNYLIKAKTFQCDENDLYGARCGILHTMRYDSNNTVLKEIVYGFYGYDKDIKNIKVPTKQVGIYIEDLWDAFITAYEIYIQHLESSSNPVVNANLDKLPNYEDLIPLD